MTAALAIVTAAAGGALLIVFKELLKRIESTRPNLAVGFVDHGGALALTVSNYHGGIGKRAECVIVDDGAHAYGVPKDDLILPGEAFDVLTPFDHGAGPYGVISARNAGQRVQYFWKLGRDTQGCRRRRRHPPLFRDPLSGPEELMRHVHGVRWLGLSAGACRFVRDRADEPLIDR